MCGMTRKVSSVYPIAQLLQVDGSFGNVSVQQRRSIPLIPRTFIVLFMMIPVLQILVMYAKAANAGGFVGFYLLLFDL